MKFSISLVALVSAALAVASPLEERKVLASGQVTFCINSGFSGACFSSNALTDQCTNLDGGLAIFNQAISSVNVPNGIFCTLFDGFSCTGDESFVSQPTPDLNVQAFNDLTSSFICSVG